MFSGHTVFCVLQARKAEQEESDRRIKAHFESIDTSIEAMAVLLQMQLPSISDAQPCTGKTDVLPHPPIGMRL